VRACYAVHRSHTPLTDELIPFNMLRMSVLIRVMDVASSQIIFFNIEERAKRLLLGQNHSDYIKSRRLIYMFRYAMGRKVRTINDSNRISLQRARANDRRGREVERENI
jgi:hypothetical protein